MRMNLQLTLRIYRSMTDLTMASSLMTLKLRNMYHLAQIILTILGPGKRGVALLQEELPQLQGQFQGKCHNWI